MRWQATARWRIRWSAAGRQTCRFAATAATPGLGMLMHAARPVLLDLSGDGWPRATAAGWADRVQVTAARSDQPLEGILVRPDGYVAWAAAAGDRDTDGLCQALWTWFGAAG